MVEAPLFVRPYLKDMSRGELFIVMTCGMAGIAGTVMVIYASVLSPVVPDAMGHILSASIISVPAAIVIAARHGAARAAAPTSGQADARRSPRRAPWTRSRAARSTGSRCCSASSRC